MSKTKSKTKAKTARKKSRGRALRELGLSRRVCTRDLWTSVAADEPGTEILTKLTSRERTFCEAFVRNGGTASAAAREAGYAPDDRGVCTAGQMLLNRERIHEAIHLLQRINGRLLADKMTVDSDRIMQELACIAFVDVAEAAHWCREALALEDSVSLPSRITRAISHVGVDAKGNVVLKMSDKLQALRMLAEMIGAIRRGEGASINVTTGQRGDLPQVQIVLPSNGREVNPKYYTGNGVPQAPAPVAPMPADDDAEGNAHG